VVTIGKRYPGRGEGGRGKKRKEGEKRWFCPRLLPSSLALRTDKGEKKTKGEGKKRKKKEGRREKKVPPYVPPSAQGAYLAK